MSFDILFVFVVSLISSLFLCTNSVHGLPATSSSSAVQYIHNHPSADLSSSLRLFRHQPMPSVDYDLGGDISAMLLGESNEISGMNTRTGSPSVSPLISSLVDQSNEPFDVYPQSVTSESDFRKLLSALKDHRQYGNEEENQQRKRFSPSSISGSTSLPGSFNFNPVVADSSNDKNSDRISSSRLSPGLKQMIDGNPLARIWLSMLLQKMMADQNVPYIFKYGRRRK